MNWIKRLFCRHLLLVDRAIKLEQKSKQGEDLFFIQFRCNNCGKLTKTIFIDVRKV